MTLLKQIEIGKKSVLNNKLLLAVFTLFALIFASITFVNHYNFRTYGWDLGINQNAIYDYAHFRWNDCMIMQPQFTNVLSDHFSLYPLLVSPFYWIFGEWTMLIFQFLAILFGGFGIYRYVQNLCKSDTIATLAVAHFFSFYGIFSALSFDYHDNVVATMFVPWFLLYFEQKNWRKTILFFALIIIAKENMALWAVFLGFGLAFKSLLKKDKKTALIGLYFALAAAIYFILVLKVIIPSLATPGRDYLHNSFNALGGNFGEVIVNILKHPIKTFELLFVNHSGNPAYDGIKVETYLALALAGGFALVLAPEYLIMIVPILGQKMFNDVPIRWGISVHYSIEFAPLIVLGFYTALQRLQKYKTVAASVFLGLTVLSTARFLDHRTSEYYNQANSQFYKKEHWQRDFDVAEVNRLLKTIPADARVSAQSCLAPHLAFRDYIFHYPFIGNANYIALLPAEENKYPYDDITYQKAIDDFIASGKWEVFAKNEAVLILKMVKK
jgi:uncharacterized membrane protein